MGTLNFVITGSYEAQPGEGGYSECNSTQECADLDTAQYQEGNFSLHELLDWAEDPHMVIAPAINELQLLRAVYEATEEVVACRLNTAVGVVDRAREQAAWARPCSTSGRCDEPDAPTGTGEAMTNLNALLTEKAEAAGLSPDAISNIELLTERYIQRIVEVNTPPRYTCAACGMTEDDHLNEWGMGPLIPVTIIIDPQEELRCWTGEPDQNGEYNEVKPARLCNEHFVEWLNAQPDWLQEHFAKVNPAHYRR